MFKRITLEMSLKPFKRTDDEYVSEVCRRVFTQWRALLDGRENISIMLWVGDGSELLDYAGNDDEEFEWCRFIGTANRPPLADGEPKETSLHQKRQDYMPNAPRMTYAILKRIVSTIKEEGKKAFPGSIIRVGETFDIGPEFAISDFKYRRHTEICSGSKIPGLGFIDATATLKADDRRYAAYPCGIPEGEPFGTFLGKQADVFLRDMGFDYLWLSNGLGFSSNPWDKTGKIFDGERYYPERLEDTASRVWGFWQLFRRECKLPLETRGTNNSVGIDYASDGVPLYDIYRAELDIIAPPNSPWAAINDNFGLEIMGHMTRVCELPNDVFPFRYYLHDPWWVNSPWYDRYDGSPCDVYLPMAISRINKEGKTEAANSFNILSIDNSYGDLPDSCVNEPLPHILKAEKDSADESGPLVWIYPMREYTTSRSAELLAEMNRGDNFICDAINDGLPLCTVTSSDSFLCHESNIYRGRVLISPVQIEKEVEDKLLGLASEGIGVIFYGSRKMLEQIPDTAGVQKIDLSGSASTLREAIARHGYEISFTKYSEDVKPPTMAISRHDRGFFFSIYNCNTTTKTHLKLPLGAPILSGGEAEIADGYSAYHFIRGEHRECRVFVKQESGVISCREAPPASGRFRRAIRLQGLDDATVVLIPEDGCAAIASLTNGFRTPVEDERFTVVHDEAIGDYLTADHISGNLFFLMERRK